MALLPVRTAVLKYLYDHQEGDINEIMEALKPMYGKEGQFKRDRFVDHVMSLEVNGLINEIGYDLDKDGQLLIRYKINDDGITNIKKYVLKKMQ